MAQENGILVNIAACRLRGGLKSLNVFDAIEQRRSIRRFSPQPVPEAALRRLAGVSECYPCPCNLQPLRFVVVQQPEDCDRVFACLRWAGMLGGGFVIGQEQRPKAYIVVVGDRHISADVQFCSGAAAAELMLAAQELGLASCCLTPADKDRLYEVLALDPQRFDIVCVVALGYPGQKSTPVPAGDSTRYWLDEEENLCVPKRSAAETVTFFAQDGEELGET